MKLKVYIAHVTETPSVLYLCNVEITVNLLLEERILGLNLTSMLTKND